MRRTKIVFALLMAVPLAAYILYPLLALLSESLSAPVAAFRARNYGWDPANQPTAAPLRAIFHEPLAREALWGTLKLAIGTVLAGGAWGLGLALLWWRREFPGRKVFALLGYAPVVLPPLVGTLAFFQLIGESGRVWAFVPVETFTNFERVLLMHAYSFGLYTYSFSAAALQDLDSAREEAARSLGAGTVRVFFAAVWPAVRGPLAAAGLLTFMAAAASFSAPYFLDNSGRYLTVEILRSQDDIGLQRGLTVVLAVVSLGVLPFFLWAGGFGARWGETAAGVKGQSRAEFLQARGAGVVVRWVLSAFAAVVLLAPPIFVVWSACVAERPGVRIPFERLTADDAATLLRSCIYGGVSALLAVVFGVAIALLLRRAKTWLALPFEWTVMLTVALPGSVVAIALLSAFNGPSLLAFGIPLGGSAVILILAYTVRTLPLAVRPARAALDALGPDVERASASLGATPLGTLWRVTLPGILPSLLAALLLCFVTGTGEFVASQLLYDSTTRPVSVQIGEHFRTDPDAAAALSFCLMVLSAAAVGAGAWVQRRARK